MGKYSEETLSSWTKPASTTEEEKINNAINMIKSALNSSQEFSNLQYELFTQGSYANNTNVRTSSDVDVNVMLTSTFFTNYPDGKTDSDYHFTEGSITYSDFKNYIIRALERKFGNSSVEIGNKSIKVASNSYRLEVDCIASFQYRDYKSQNSSDPHKFIEGIKYLASDGESVINYPKEHIVNGITKNNSTNRQFKRLVRLFKRIKNKMANENLVDSQIITSFLIECLVWNIPDNVITRNLTWDETVKESVVYLYNQIKDNQKKDWGEVSEKFYLFHSGRKWRQSEVENFLVKMWIYMGYDK